MSYKKITVEKSEVFPEVIIIKPSVGVDHRGTIFTTYTEDLYKTFLPDNVKFIHDKFAESKKDVLRGLHGDNKTWKLISCIHGEIYEVVVDNRPESETYLKWDFWILNDKNKKQVLVPPNFVNGYLVISENATFHYKLAYKDEYFDVDKQYVIKWNDPRLKIPWPVKTPILQERDK
ncbi:MAG: dTDP-4-dehydrorhamnose 3,5-epimerase family protein [Candidatus Aureabacteria bacterium]|nr:dTDP-4-dehydrorhamnose 3,5-epimerase family protein [Candidatus Auribacterota bacterium]